MAVSLRRLPCNRRVYIGMIDHRLPTNAVLQYGANTRGIHGAGSAKTAKLYYGAVVGRTGFCGRSYGIVTKDLAKNIHPSVPAIEILTEIGKFYDFAYKHPDKDFFVAYRAGGSNLNHYTPEQMAALYAHAYRDRVDTPVGIPYTRKHIIDMIPPNVIFENNFYELMCNY